jgi:hypothetical protein
LQKILKGILHRDEETLTNTRVQERINLVRRMDET